MSYSVKNMVEKPTEGLCSRCDSESLEFYDDGSGRCLNCGRNFRWADKGEISQESKVQERPQTTREFQFETMATSEVSQQNRATPSISRTNGESRTTSRGYTPDLENRTSKKSSGRKALWVGVVGFIFMIAGYVLLSLNMMEIGLEEHIEIIRGLFVLFTSIGVLIAGTGLAVHGATADDLGDNVRLGLLLSAALLIGIYLGIGQHIFYL